MRHAASCVLACALVVGACGPDVSGDDVFPRNCGVDGPVDLFEPGDADVRTAKVVGDHVVLELAAEGWTELLAVERCGGEPRTLLRMPSAQDLIFGSFGDELLACDVDAGTIDRLDVRGDGPPVRLFETSNCCLYPVAGGLAARNTVAGTIEFVADPSARTPMRVTIANANEPGNPLQSDHFGDCGLWWAQIEPLTLGDLLLVPLRDGGLVAVDPRSGAHEIVAEGELTALRPVDGDRYALWAVDGVETYLFDRTTGASTRVGTWAGWVHPVGEWIVDAPAWPYPDGAYVVARHLPEGATHVVTTDPIFDTVEDWAGWNRWWPSSALSAESLVVEVPMEEFGLDVPSQSHVFWPSTGALEPVDLPPPNYSDRVVTDAGIFAFDDDAIRFLPPEGPPMRTILDIRPGYPRATPDAHLISVDYGEGQTSGTLRVHVPGGTTYEIDRDVTEPLRSRDDRIHHHSAPDLVYLAEVDGRTVVRRTVLP